MEVDVSLGCIAFLINGAAGLIIIALDYVWKDGRTHRHKRLRGALWIVMCAGILVGFIATQVAERDRANEAGSLRSQLTHLEHQNIALAAQVADLRKLLEPLIREIKRRHPHASDDEVRRLVGEELGKWDVGKWDQGVWDKDRATP